MKRCKRNCEWNAGLKVSVVLKITFQTSQTITSLLFEVQVFLHFDESRMSYWQLKIKVKGSTGKDMFYSERHYLENFVELFKI